MLLFLLIGAVIGLAAGGLAGAAIGAAAGALLGRALLTTLFGRGLDAVRGQFLESTFAVMGAVSKADGRVGPAEIRTAERFFDRLSLSAEQRRAAQQAFKRGKGAGFDVDDEVARLRAAAGRSISLLQFFIEVQIAAATADGAVEAPERELLLRIAHGLGLSPPEVERLEALLRGPRHERARPEPGGRQQLAQAYDTLGVSPDATDDEIKRAYRRAMSKHHPDKLAARGMPETMRPVAEEKTREIRAAYDAIQAERG
jgi:DnaJ like chaperone protein